MASKIRTRKTPQVSLEARRTASKDIVFFWSLSNCWMKPGKHPGAGAPLNAHPVILGIDWIGR